MGRSYGVQEWRDSLFLIYDIDPPELPDHCNGCGMAFDICHTLYCKKGGLNTVRHNNLHDGLSELASKDFTPVHVRDYPKNYTGCAVRGGKDDLKGYP